MHMRNFRFKDSSFFDMFASPIHAKRRLITPIMKRFPKRKFILVGDSGEKDPEVYAEFAREYPDQVKAIFIRRAPEKEKESGHLSASSGSWSLRGSSPQKSPAVTHPTVGGEAELSDADATLLRERGIEEIREDEEEDDEETSEDSDKEERERKAEAEEKEAEKEEKEGEGLSPKEERLARENKRWEVAFKGLEGKVLWRIFDTPEELADIDFRRLLR